jgi:5'(3')-deoxyribonucleotidase
MDNVLVDFPSAFPFIDKETLDKFKDNKDEIPNIFSLMKPMPGAIEAITFLSKHFDIYILSTAPWLNPSAWSDKLLWIQKYFGKDEDSILYKRLILSHHKDLNSGDYLIDDRTKNGVENFKGEHIYFGKDGNFKNWNEVVDYLTKKEITKGENNE